MEEGRLEAEAVVVLMLPQTTAAAAAAAAAALLLLLHLPLQLLQPRSRTGAPGRSASPCSSPSQRGPAASLSTMAEGSLLRRLLLLHPLRGSPLLHLQLLLLLLRIRPLLLPRHQQQQLWQSYETSPTLHPWPKSPRSAPHPRSPRPSEPSRARPARAARHRTGRRRACSLRTRLFSLMSARSTAALAVVAVRGGRGSEEEETEHPRTSPRPCALCASSRARSLPAA